MAAEAGHHPDRTYLDQSGGIHVNGSDTALGPNTEYTQTYSTAAAVVPAAVTITTVATAVTKTNSSPYGFDSTDADKIVALAAAVPTDLAALAADNLALKKLINQLIDDLQAMKLAG